MIHSINTYMIMYKFQKINYAPYVRIQLYITLQQRQCIQLQPTGLDNFTYRHQQTDRMWCWMIMNPLPMTTVSLSSGCYHSLTHT